MNASRSLHHRLPITCTLERLTLERFNEIEALVTRLKVPMGYLDRLDTLRADATYVRAVPGQRAHLAAAED